MCVDCLCVHNSLCMHDVQKWDETDGMYIDYIPTGRDSVLLGPGVGCVPSIQTTSGRRKNVNIGGNHSLPFLLGRGIFPSNPKRITRCFSRTYLDLCTSLTQIGAISQTNLQRIFTGGFTPDHDIFNETFLFYRVISRQLRQRLFDRLEMVVPLTGHVLHVLCMFVLK